MSLLSIIDPQVEAQSIIDFIKKTFGNAHKSTAVIGLSGGIDSATSFALAIQALGVDHIHAYHLPSKTTNPQHLKDIQLLASNFQLPTSHLHIIPISAIIQKSWRITLKSQRIEAGIQELATAAGPHEVGARTNNSDSDEITNKNLLRLANLSARTRMMLLFDQAKKLDALVIGTENKSESQLGYFTRFGDAASDLEPITRLYKTQVIKLAKFLKIPDSIIDKPPSADLWTGQTDAAELGFTYAQADPILYLLSQNKSPSEIITQGFTKYLVDQVIAQVNKNHFKSLVPYRLDK